MKFLFGLLLGAAVTLLIAGVTTNTTDTKAQDNKSAEKILNSIAQQGNKLISAWQRSEPNDANIDTTTTEPAQSTQASSNMVASEQAQANFESNLNVARSEAQVEKANGEPLDAPNSLAQVVLPEVQVAPDMLTSARTSEPLTVTEVKPPVEVAATGPQPYDESQFFDPSEVTGSTVIWSPFHSEASASGFANRLTRELAHPFTVKKQAPAKYVVSYDYGDAEHKAQLEARIKTITGVKQ